MLNQSGKIALVIFLLILLGLITVSVLPVFKQKSQSNVKISSSEEASPSSSVPLVGEVDVIEGDTSQTPYENSEFGFSFFYPSSWEVVDQRQSMKYGNLFSIYTRGETQNDGTEFHDGASFEIGIPQKTTKDLSDFVMSYHGATNSHGAENEFAEALIGDKWFQKVLVCEYGCTTFYHIKNGDYIYSIGTFADGAKVEAYEKFIERMLTSITFE